MTRTRPNPTPLILTVLLSNHAEADFLPLCYEWGKWSRGGGVMGWGKAPEAEPWTIDDDSALCLDAALGDLGREWPSHVDLIHMHFKRGLDFGEIAEALASPRPLSVRDASRGLGVTCPAWSSLTTPAP